MKRSRKKPPPVFTYAKACKVAALMDYWTTEDAAALLLNEIPSGLSRRKLPKVKATRVARAAYIFSGSNCVVNPESPISRFRVKPREIIDWTHQRNGATVPEELVNAVMSAAEETRNSKAFFKQSTFHGERCRAIAALLWNSDETKHLTLEAMAKHPELLQFGCQGHAYEHDTIKNWIKEQNPNRKAGRRPHPK
jgi:hypothetical protein